MANPPCVSLNRDQAQKSGSKISSKTSSKSIPAWGILLALLLTPLVAPGGCRPLWAQSPPASPAASPAATPAPASPAASPASTIPITPQDQQAIAQLRQLAVEAINSRDFSKIQPYLHPSFTITTVDNRIFRNVQEFGSYWNQQFTGPVESIAMEVSPDTSRTFLSPDTEVAYGEATARFTFKDGNAATMPMRWTAIVQKSQGQWTLQSLHFSANLLDNPVLNAAQRLGRTVAIGAGVGSFLVGIGVGWVLRRRSGVRE